MNNKMKSVKSISPCEFPPEWLSRTGVIQIIYDIVKAPGRVPVATVLKVETKEGEGTDFNIVLPL